MKSMQTTNLNSTRTDNTRQQSKKTNKHNTSILFHAQVCPANPPEQATMSVPTTSPTLNKYTHPYNSLPVLSFIIVFKSSPWLFNPHNKIRSAVHSVQRRAGGRQNTAASPCLEVLLENRLFERSDEPSPPRPPEWPFAAASRVIVDGGLDKVLDMNPSSGG
jgi:hypothetical protein